MFTRLLRFLRSFFNWVGYCYTGFFRSSSSSSSSISFPPSRKVPLHHFRVWLGRYAYLRIPTRTGKFLFDNGFLYCQVITYSGGVWFYFYRERLRNCIPVNISSSTTANKRYYQYRINGIRFINTLRDAFNAFGISLADGQLLKIAEVRYSRDCIKMRIVLSITK